MKKSVMKLCVVLALSASMVFGGMVTTQAAHVDAASERVVGFMPFDLPTPNYD